MEKKRRWWLSEIEKKIAVVARVTRSAHHRWA